MKKILFCVILLAFSLSFFSCDFFTKIAQNDNYVTSVSFKSGKYVLYLGEQDVCYVEVNPSDSFDWYETVYNIEDSETCSIEAYTDQYCIVKALKVGSTILTAKIGNSEGKCVITVREF